MKKLIITILILFSSCEALFLFAQEKQLKFEKITIDHGLSQSAVFEIYKDKEGFVWIGTLGGLNRFDGYQFKSYKTSVSGKNSISGNFVNCLHESRDGIFWVGTQGGGINKFNKDKDRFETIKVPSTENGIDRILSLYEDRKGNMYFGTDEAGMIFIEKKTGTVKVLHSTISRDQVLESNTPYDFIFHNGSLLVATANGIQEVDSLGNFRSVSVTYENRLPVVKKFYKDKTGAVWVAWEKGLGRLREKGDEYEIESPIEAFTKITVKHIEEDNLQNLWVATYGNGLLVINRERNKWDFYKKDFYNPTSINNNDVNTIYKDNTGIMWVGTNDGVNKYDESVNDFESFQSEFSENLLGILEDQEGNVWFSTLSSGVSKFNVKTRKTENYQSSRVHSDFLCEDKNGDIWSLTPYKSLNKFSKIQHQFEAVFSLPAGYTMLCASDGKIYLPTFKEGLKVIDPKSKNLESIKYSPNLKNIYSFCESQSSIWLGSQFGIVGELNKSTKRITDFKLKFKDQEIERKIISILEDSKGNLWFGTSGLGLFLYDAKNKKCVASYTQKDGLPSDDVLGIQEDKTGKLWISTFKGLASLDHRTKEINTYVKQDGLIHNEFSYNVHFKGKKGSLYFGGIAGFNYFIPENIKKNTIAPPVYFTNFQIFNKSIPVKDNSDSSCFFLESIIENTREINLPYDQNVLTFEFAALNYSLSEKNKYAYKLEGFDDEWIYSGTKRSATYTNLNAGKYTLRVKATNNDGVWNETGASLNVIIQPPFWNTWYAYLVYFGIFMLMIYARWKHFTNKIKINNELNYNKLEAQKLQEVDEIKTRFYTNVSHEFRTPLTLILGPLETATSLSANLEEKEIKRNLDMVTRNAQRLLELINQLMDFSKLETGNMKLNLHEDDIILFLRTCTLAFSSLAISKGIDLQFKTTAEQLVTEFDKDKLEKILNNLLSNALKFTGENGAVEVFVDFEGDKLLLKVKDNGVGIPGNEVSDIFNRFYQVNNSSKTYEGTGIGLALLKELVAIHKGTIEVQSKVGEGTVFTLIFPIEIKKLNKTIHSQNISFVEGMVIKRKTALDSAITAPNASNKAFVSSEETAKTLNENIILEQTKSDGVSKNGRTSEVKPIILIVEDNYEVREYIKSAFGKDFTLYEAENGEAGLACAEKHIPDLIITDIMMPKMDGQELCLLLKTNEKTSHIPLIMLTAKSSQESKLEGLETGADDYITKPFHVQELQVRVRNLIEQREKLRKRFTREVILQPKDIAITSADEKFLNRCISIIEEHMSDPDFSVDAFGKEVGMSRSQLHRKLKALIDQSTSEFIRNIRLKRASDLIKNKYGNTAEVAYEVGFNNVSYFIKCFKEVYGKTPTEMEK